MIEWSDEQQMMRDAVRQFVEKEIKPHHRGARARRHCRPTTSSASCSRTFGMDAMARDRFKRQIEREKAVAGRRGEEPPAPSGRAATVEAATPALTADPDHRAVPLLPRHGHGHGRVDGPHRRPPSCPRAPSPRRSAGSLDLLTLEKIGAWAITEPDSGSDAFGSMKSTARRDGDEYVLNGSKTFITNGPYADTIVFICKLDEGNPPAERKVLQLRPRHGHARPRAVQAAAQDGHALARPPASCSSTDVRVGRDRLIGETEDVAAGGREGAKDTFPLERSGVAAMALGIVEQCLELCVALRQGPGAVRPADRRVPAHPAQAGQDGGRPPQRPEPRLPPDRDVGRRQGHARSPRRRP